MSKTDIAARAAKLGDRKGGRATESSVEDQPTVSAPVPRAKPVRVTTDLAPQSYRELVAYCQRLAEDLGRAKVPHVEVIRALVGELETNPELQATVANTVRRVLSK
ncbi:MAG: hypothetical protein ACTHWA_13025 [Arachnia sp.]